MESLKEEVARVDTVGEDSDKLLAQVRESEQLTVNFNVAIVGRNFVERLRRSLVAESVSAFNAATQQVRYEVVSRIRQGLERAYYTVRVPYLVELTRVSGVAETSIH